MNNQDHVLSFMDLLDLDEEVIDTRLKTIMNKEKHSNKNLVGAIQLLKYKQLVNVQDGTDCENDDELEFAAKLIRDMREETVDNVCNIVAATLALNTSTLVNQSEHLLQQILSEIDLPKDSRESPDTPRQNNALWTFKITDSILDIVLSKGEKVVLPFLELPVKSILHSSDDKVKLHFLATTVPKLFQGVSGYSILDKIWEYIKELKDQNKEIALNVLSSLSEYYLPIADSKGKALFESVIIYQYEFWDIIFHGLLSTDPSVRKISMYLAKRALDCVMALNKSVCVKTNGSTIFSWDHSNRKNQKVLWDNFFILIDSLEEKQSNIVLPSLQLFGLLKSFGNWLNCAFNIGLKHDNTQVRLKCIQYRLQTKLKSQLEAIVLLEALNDISLYDNLIECEDLKKKIQTFISDTQVFVQILTAIPHIKWSPVPFYHMTSVLSEIIFKDLVSETDINICQSIIDVLKVPCNIKLIRKAVCVNLSHFVGNCCVGLHWKDIISIFCILQTEVIALDDSSNPINSLFSKKSIGDNEKIDLFKVILGSHSNIDFGLMYLRKYPLDLPIFLDLLSDKIKTIDEIVSRQYLDKSKYLQDVIYLMQLFVKARKDSTNSSSETITTEISKAYKSILCFNLSLLSNNVLLSLDEMNMLSTGFSFMSNSMNNSEYKEVLLQLYKTAVLFIRDKDTVLGSKVLGMHIIYSLTNNDYLLQNYKHEMLSLKDIITLTTNFENKQSIGRLRNAFYEKSCEIVDTLMKDQELEVDKYVKDIAAFVENVIECGGYGCLRICLNVMNTILACLLDDDNLKLDMIQFINRMWKEIEELKSNNQYNPCIEEFVNLITHDALLKRSMYNNIIIFYCSKIIEYGSVKPAPLYYLVRNLNSKNITQDHGQLIYVLSEILLYSLVPRKDQRIVENLLIEILLEEKHANNKGIDIYFNFQIQYLSLLILTKIMDRVILYNIEMFIKNRIDEAFKNKQRYHGHSQAHRLLLTAVQHLLLLAALNPDDSKTAVTWCVDLLGRLPHQPSVRICLEWYIAFHFYIQKKIINHELLNELKNISLTSQFTILFWTIKRKLEDGVCSTEEYEFVMEVLLSHTMGQMFNIRLNAQYLATRLYAIYENASSKFSYTIKVIENTFVESAKDKNFMKLQEDYFVNSFDIINDYTTSFIYYFLPRYCEINNNESVDITFVKDIVKKINLNVKKHDIFKNEKYHQKCDEEIFSLKICKDTKVKVVDEIEELGTIQKKYVPWNHMSDINVYEAGKKKKSPSELIVVASLIDKLPNLGGMARTSEVFGVKTYVVDSLRHLQDKQFQGLSVSAERWIDVEEIRPGQPLKQYLFQKKAEGYSVVAAEQTSTSVKLQSFKFPKKTLLLLGHEKEGIPCDLLPMMDYCVEIPQQGFVRSLNVHVTAAIFVWEYSRQNIL